MPWKHLFIPGILAIVLSSHAFAEAQGQPLRPIKELVGGQWRFPGEKLVRITARVKVLSAHTLLCEDGTEIDLNGNIDAPDLAQKGLIDGSFYPCGEEATRFLERLIGDKRVTCFIDTSNLRSVELSSNPITDAGLEHLSALNHLEELNLNNKRGLWRGEFVVPKHWRNGERLSGETAGDTPPQNLHHPATASP